ncbi:MAG: site-specific integrase [Lachnospiraceae bacterium]|nr:site-specific integrase [Lachnospiraceae bacterium]
MKLKPRPDGRYCCRYKDKFFYGSSSDVAYAARDAYIKKEAAGQLLRRELTVKDYALKWLPLYKSGVSDKCYNDYAKQLEALFPVIGNLHMSQVTVDDAATVWQHYAGYSASTIKRARMLYIALFDAAIENDLCRKNPFKSKFSQPPRGSAGTHRALEQPEIDLILRTPHRFQLAVLVMLYAGLRRGEVLALSSDDIDLSAGLIHVNKAVRFDGNQPALSDPKTEAGHRSVPILSVLRPFLENYTGLIAPSASGSIMSESAFDRAWQSYLLALSSAAGHPVSIRCHDLRHTYCTMLVDAGVPLKQAMVWLGHADEKMILRVYDHVLASRSVASVAMVENHLSGNTPAPDLRLAR